MKKNYLITTLIIVSLFLGTWAYIKAEGQQITICVKKNNLVYVVGEDFIQKDCKKADSLLSWNAAGQKGEKGDVGPQGPAGTNATALHVYDANNQDLGIVIDIDPQLFSQTISYLPNPGIFLQIRQGVIVNTDAVWFTQPDCTGTPYSRYGNPGGTIVSPQNSRAFKFIRGQSISSSDNYKFASRLAGGTCANNQGGPDLAIPMEEVTLPFSLPIAWPLSVRQ